MSEYGVFLVRIFPYFDWTRRFTWFFISNTFISNTRLKLAKYQAKAKQHSETELLLFEIYTLSSFMLSSKTNMRYSKKCAKNKCFCFNDIMQIIIMKMRLKIKNGSHRYHLNRTRPTHGHKYTKYKWWLSIMMVICIEAFFQRCSVTKVLLEISLNSQGNTCARDSGTGVFLWILRNF